MIHVIGAGGHAKVVIEALMLSQGSAPALCVRDGNADRAGALVLGHAVVTPELDADMTGSDVHVAIGAASARERLYREAIARGAGALTVIHPGAFVSPSAVIGAGSFVAAGAVIGPGAQIGKGVIVNHGAIIDHDCRVGDFAHVAPGATLGGGVRVGDRCLIGARAVCLPLVHVGDETTIGAGAVVTRGVGAGEVWFGNPASRQSKVTGD